MAVDAQRGANTFKRMPITPQISNNSSVFQQTGQAAAPVPPLALGAVSSVGVNGGGKSRDVRGYKRYHPSPVGSNMTPVDESLGSGSVGPSEPSRAGGGGGGGSDDVFSYAGDDGVEWSGGGGSVVSGGGHGMNGSGEHARRVPSGDRVRSTWERGGGAPTPKVVWRPDPAMTGVVGADVGGGEVKRASHLPQPRDSDELDPAQGFRREDARGEAIAPPEWVSG